MKTNNKIIVNRVTIIMAFILILTQIFFEMNSDVLGILNIETKIVSVAEVVANIIIPLAIIVTVSFKKDLVSIVLLVSRSFINCIPVVIYAIENNQVNKSNVGVIALNIVYIAILTSVCFVEISNKVVMTLVIICRMMIVFFSRNLYHLLYGLENGGTYLLPNVLYLLTSEFLFILPVIYYNDVKLGKVYIKQEVIGRGLN